MEQNKARFIKFTLNERTSKKRIFAQHVKLPLLYIQQHVAFMYVALDHFIQSPLSIESPTKFSARATGRTQPIAHRYR